MSFPGKPHRTRGTAIIAFVSAAASLLFGVSAYAKDEGAETILKGLRPDYQAYVGAVRPLAGEARASAATLYMALVKPGATDPSQRDNAPFSGRGARNDILYDPALLDRSGHSEAWMSLLLDHEYFHARHLAGATSLPLAPRGLAILQRHFYEAAAWGFNVAQARAGRYPGLLESEFREALDRYGEHYRALRDMSADAPPAWCDYSSRLREPASLVTNGSRPPEAPARPSDPDR